jgi:hypothetical protein
VSTPGPKESDPQDILMVDGDVVLDEQGLHFVYGIQAVVQAVRFRFLLFLGEWFLNQEIGVDYWGQLIGDASKKSGLEARASAAFAAQILATPGVVEIRSLTVKLDAKTRNLTVTWQASCSFGDTPVVTFKETV